MNLDEAKLALQASLGEDSQRRFLPGGEDAMTLSCEIAALANTQGGTVFWGIREDGLVEGLARESLPRANRVLQAAAESLTPPVVVHTQNIPLAGNRLVVVVEVPEGKKPCLDREGRHWVKSAAGRILVPQNERERDHERTQDGGAHPRQRSLSLASLLNEEDRASAKGRSGAKTQAAAQSPAQSPAQFSDTRESCQSRTEGGRTGLPSHPATPEVSPAEVPSPGDPHVGEDRLGAPGAVAEHHTHENGGVDSREAESGERLGKMPATAGVEGLESSSQGIGNPDDFHEAASLANMGDQQKIFEKKFRFDANSPDGREAKEVYRLMKNDTNVTVDTMSVHLGKSRRTVLKRVAHLKDLGVLVRHGTSRGGHWEVVPEVALDLGLEDVPPVDGEAEKR